MVDENMANAARVHAIESGKSYAGRTLIAFGGGGPVHACRVAEKVGIDRVLVPGGAGVGSAIGFLRAPVGYEVVRSLYQRLGRFDAAAVDALLSNMTREAESVVALGGFGAPTRQTRIAYMRYVGQGHEIPVTLPPGRLGDAEVTGLRAAFDAEYAQFYDRPVPGSDVEVMSYAVTVATVPDPAPASTAAALVPSATRMQQIRDTATGEVSGWAVHDRASLAVGQSVRGPAIIAEEETSTLVGPGWRATVDPRGYLDLVREMAA